MLMVLNDKQKEDIKASLENILKNILEKDISEAKMKNILNTIEKEIQEPLPEKILKCIKCGRDIIAHGIRGDAFVTINGTNNDGNDDKHYHMNCKKDINTKSDNTTVNTMITPDSTIPNPVTNLDSAVVNNTITPDK